MDHSIEVLWEVSERLTGEPFDVAATAGDRHAREPGRSRRGRARQRMRTLVARHGLHGTSMAAVAAEAGVATGTAYVHYHSKDDLVLAAYLELKRELGAAAVAPRRRPGRARRSGSVRCGAAPTRSCAPSPSGPASSSSSTAPRSPPAPTRVRWRMATTPSSSRPTRPDMAALLAPLPLEVLYDLGIGPVVRLVASGARLSRRQLDAMATAGWRAITRP